MCGSTASYEARKYGVRSAMPGFIAKELCPQLLFVHHHGERYKAVSQLGREVFALYDPTFQMMSLDEAYLDITDFLHARMAAERAGHPAADADVDPDSARGRLEACAASVTAELRAKVREKTGLTCSAGIAVNSMLAKIASDFRKPNGQFLVPFDRAGIVDFMAPLPVRKIPGIGTFHSQVVTPVVAELTPSPPRVCVRESVGENVVLLGCQHVQGFGGGHPGVVVAVDAAELELDAARLCGHRPVDKEGTGTRPRPQVHLHGAHVPRLVVQVWAHRQV